jgi:short-subunit dehydrogenase
VAGKSPVPGGASYAASKAAVVSLTETARVEFRGQGVEFTCVMPSFTATDLIAGTKGTRFVATIKPDDVAAAITAAVAEPRYDVYVPKSVGAIIKLNSLLGRKVRDGMARALKADRTFLDFDSSARASYEERISGSSASDAPSREPASRP